MNKIEAQQKKIEKALFELIESAGAKLNIRLDEDTNGEYQFKKGLGACAMKLTTLLLFISLGATAQVIDIPDAKFQLLLTWNTELNTNGDIFIDSAEAANYTGSIDVSGEGITDLTGIEHFTSLTELDCSDNLLTELDISECDSLEVLKVHSNQLTHIDVSNNKKLTTFFASVNNLEYVDMRNGNNENMLFVAIVNPNVCISVDDQDYSNTNWGDLKDTTATYSNDCLTIGIEEKEISTKIESIYDLYGRRVFEVKPNVVYIIRFEDGRVIKRVML